MYNASYADKQQVVKLLCDSFDANKSVNFVVKQDQKRKLRIKMLMEYSFDICYLFGEVIILDDGKGCALLVYPDKKVTTVKTILLDCKLALKSIGISRITKILKREKRIKSNHPSDPFLYLWFIGVAPQDQGKGLGKQILANVLQMGMEEKRPVYLETSMVENLDFYNKMGFEIYKELEMPYRLFLLRNNLDL